MILAWDARLFPRSMGRDLWRAHHRWMRITRKALAADQETARRNVSALGVTHPGIAHELAMRLVNPPVLLGPMYSSGNQII